jgi:predicted MPP superfamily phosphohydrolase
VRSDGFRDIETGFAVARTEGDAASQGSPRGLARPAATPHTKGVSPSSFVVASWGAWLVVVLMALAFRSRAYATFRGVTLGIQVLVASALVDYFGRALPLVAYLQATVFVSSLVLIRPKLRGVLYRTFVSVPAAFFAAGTLLAWPWAIVSAFGVTPHGAFIPYVLAGIGIFQSLTTREEAIDVVVADGERVEGLRRHAPTPLRVDRPLKVVQITDPHLGPFMSVERLKRIAERAVAREPDLIVLTGDFLTMESHGRPELLAAALAPLRALEGRTFACLGNHDHESLSTVTHALEQNGVRLLVDEAAEVVTEAGRVQILGLDFVWRKREEHLARVTAAHPRTPGALRLLLLHDPGAFKHVPEGEADLVLSGHTHGGQVGLVSLGLPYTMMRAFVKMPDHGLWARGVDRLYVHRGTGHYGFPLRLGVPSEESVLHVHAVAAGSPA